MSSQHPIPMPQREQPAEPDMAEIVHVMRDGLISLAKNVARASGHPMRARCPHCGAEFMLDKADKRKGA